jgi:hypothetical protein
MEKFIAVRVSMGLGECHFAAQGQVLTATTDTSFKSPCHKVSGEPTPRRKELLIFASTPCSTPCQIKPKARDFCPSCSSGADRKKNGLFFKN